MSTTATLARAGLIVSGAFFVSRVLGWLRLVVIANQLPDPSELDASVIARIPTRCNTDDRYFTDSYQYMPRHGYTRLFERMLDHPRLTLMLQADYDASTRRKKPEAKE